MKYTFEIIEQCDMCGAPSERFKTLGKRLNKSQGKTPKNKVGISTTVQQCSQCDLIFSNPMPIPESLQDHYGVPPEEYWIDSYFEVSENYFKGVINWLQTIQPNLKSGKVLDIGAGIGKSMIALEMAGYEVYGIEPSIPFYQRAIDKMGIKPEQIKNVSIEEADFDMNSFDFITFGAVLEHLYHPSSCIEKAMNWLKPGGILHAEVPSSHWLTNKLINRIYRIKGLDYVANISPMHEPFHLYEFGLKSFTFNARRSNYKVKDHVYMVGDTFLPKSLDFVLKPYMKRKNKGMQLAVMLQKNG